MSADNIDTRAPYVRLRVGRRPQFVVLAAATLDAPDGDWTLEALCAQTDPDVFYPVKGGSTRDAKRICQRCPVIAACSQWALDHDERYGVWGGMSEWDRRRLKHGDAMPAKPGRGAPIAAVLDAQTAERSRRLAG